MNCYLPVTDLESRFFDCTMKCIVSTIIFYLFGTLIGFAQPRDKYAADAFVIARMAQKFHVQSRPMDESFSVQFFDHFFTEADGDRVIFTTEDMTRLLPYRVGLAEEVLKQQNGFLKLVTGIYEQRTRRIDSILLGLQQQAFSFTSEEKLTVAEDSSYAANAQLQQQKLTKLVKKAILDYIIEHGKLSISTPVARQKKITDSLEPEARKKIITGFQRGLHRLQQGVKGIPASMGNLYCESLATTFDPHTSYLPKTEKENFESSIGSKSMRFGFSLEKEGENVSIHDLKPGSAAYKSGQISKGDKIISLQWEGKEPSDVSEASLEEVSAIFAESNYAKMILTIKKADGALRKVELQKESMETDDDENKVKSFLLKSTESTIGYLSLPAFYTDWDDIQHNVKGCANDVAKAILRLKKDNINGLILDLRYNGGGSVQEAIELSGIFIDAGPVGQTVPSGGKMYTLKDVNRGTIYDGSLIVLVNGASASASEMVAGTLQDYHRAIIMGTPTYGKATSQVIMPLDSLTKPDASHQGSMAETFLKLTIEKLYRVTGVSAQRDGVLPDIQLPDLTELVMPREANEPTALYAQRIEANRFYTPYAADNISANIYRGRAMVDTSNWYKQVKKNAGLIKEMNRKTDLSLRLQDALSELGKNEANEKLIDQMVYDASVLFTVQNPLSEEQRLKLLPDAKEMNGHWKTSLLHDAWIATAFQVLSNKK
jgi:carboxyl-terminal processing protease